MLHIHLKYLDTNQKGENNMSRVVKLIGRSGSDTSMVTALAADVLDGKVFVDSAGMEITGSIPDNSFPDNLIDGGEVTIHLNAGQEQTFEPGYYNHRIITTAKSLKDQTPGNLKSWNIAKGLDGWADGKHIYGNAPTTDWVLGENEIVYVTPGAEFEIPYGFIYNPQTIKVISTADSIKDEAPYKANATPADLLPDKTAWVNGVKITGTMTVVNIRGSAGPIVPSLGETLVYPQGYYDEQWSIKIPSLVDETSGDATAANITLGKTAWVNGVRIIGTYEPGEVGDLIVATEGDATATDILAGKTAWVNGEKIIGSLDPESVPSHISSLTQATATADTILDTYTAWVNGEQITGTIPIITQDEVLYLYPDIQVTIDSAYYTNDFVVDIPPGYSLVQNDFGDATSADILRDKTAWINGEWVTGTLDPDIKVGTLAGETLGNATARDIIVGRTAWVNGEKIVGEIAVHNIVNGDNILTYPGDSIDIHRGYYTDKTTIRVDYDIIKNHTIGTATAANITLGKTAWVNGEMITGTYEPGEVGDLGAASGTAIAENILNTKTAWVNGEMITGTMPNNDGLGTKKPNVNGNPPTMQPGEIMFTNNALNAGESFTIPAGYTDGGIVYAQALYDQTEGNATADSILKDKIAWVNGVRIIGTVDIDNGDTTPGNATETDILIGKTAWVNGEQILGSVPIYGGDNGGELASGETFTIEGGQYIPSDITVTGKSIVQQTLGDATSNDIKIGKIAWVNGVQITGTLLSTEGGGDVDLSAVTQGTATAVHILEGDIAWVNGEMITGTMPNNGVIETMMPEISNDNGELGENAEPDKPTDGSDENGSSEPEINTDNGESEGEVDTNTSPTSKPAAILAGESFTIPAGYTDGGIIYAESLNKQTTGTAVSSDIKVGKTAWVNGEQVIGTLPVYRASDEGETVEVAPGESYTVPEGYYCEGALTITNEKLDHINGTATAADVVKGKTINIDNKLVEGTLEGLIAPLNVYVTPDNTPTFIDITIREDGTFDGHNLNYCSIMSTDLDKYEYKNGMFILKHDVKIGDITHTLYSTMNTFLGSEFLTSTVTFTDTNNYDKVVCIKVSHDSELYVEILGKDTTYVGTISILSTVIGWIPAT